MAEFGGHLHLLDRGQTRLRVSIDLDEERLTIRAGSSLIGTWALSEVGVRGEDDGFHLRLEGEEVVISTNDDPSFARLIGLHSASPIMRRRIAGAMHEKD